MSCTIVIMRMKNIFFRVFLWTNVDATVQFDILIQLKGFKTFVSLLNNIEKSISTAIQTTLDQLWFVSKSKIKMV